MAYSGSEDLAKRTAANKVLRDKAFNIAKDSKYDEYQRGLASMVYKYFDKKNKDDGVKFMPQNKQLAKELDKKIIRKFKKRKVHSAFKDYVSGIDLADTQLISKFNKGFRFLLCVIDIFSKYAWVVPLKDKKGVYIVNAFQKILKQSPRKSKKVWTTRAANFITILSKKFLHDNDCCVCNTQ